MLSGVSIGIALFVFFISARGGLYLSIIALAMAVIDLIKQKKLENGDKITPVVAIALNSLILIVAFIVYIMGELYY